MSTAELIRRIERYRSVGHPADGLHTLRGYQVDDLDYLLMGCDNSTAKAHGSSERQLLWFAVDRSSDLAHRSFGNSHGSSDDGGKTFYNETALMDIPTLEGQRDPLEVAWHYRRFMELRAADVPQPERVRIMTEERQGEPWASWVVDEGPPRGATERQPFVWLRSLFGRLSVTT